MNTSKRLYVLVNKKLNPIYGCVQGGHALAQWMLENPNQTWNNDFLIYLYADVDKWASRLTKMGVPYSAFKEPDLNNTMTALACRDDSGELFKNLQVVK